MNNSHIRTINKVNDNKTEIFGTTYPVVRERIHASDNGFKRGDVVKLKNNAAASEEVDDFFVALKHTYHKLVLLRITNNSTEACNSVESVNVNCIDPLVYGNVEEQKFNASEHSGEAA